MEPMIWLILLVVLIVVEILTMGLTTIWFAGGALVAFLSALLGAPLPVQVGSFLIASIVLLIFTRPLAMKYLNRNRVRTNVESLIGKKAVVCENIDNLRSVGKVMVNGIEWTARSIKEDELIEKDTVVRIVRVDGVKLMVEKEGGH